jgi:serine/threonine protein kinase
MRLCDFGLADFLACDDTPSPREPYPTPHSHDTKPHIRPEDMVAGGSLAYAAPEQIESKTPLLDTAIDMWSYGIVVYALLMGELPFYDHFAPKLQMMILKGEWNVERFRARVDPEICEVVMGCLQVDPKLRWTAEDVLRSQWISLYNEADE